jgi:hypothetical protein
LVFWVLTQDLAALEKQITWEDGLGISAPNKLASFMETYEETKKRSCEYLNSP